MKFRAFALIFIILAFLFSCNPYNVCRNKRSINLETQIWLFDFPEIPERVRLYVYSKNNDFARPIRGVNQRYRGFIQYTVILENEEYIRREVVRLHFSQRLLKNRDYRVVVDDTIFFDISNLVFDARVGSQWTAVGSVRSCVIFGMKVNGIPLEEHFLMSSRFHLPYSMGRIVHND